MCVAISSVQRHAERLDQVEHHLAAGGGRRIEPVELAVAAVAGMVVDVDDEEPIEPGDAGPREVAALHDDRGVEVALDTLVGDLDVGDAGKRSSGAGARSVLTTSTSFPSARSA